MAISDCAFTGSYAPRTVQFSGSVQGIPLTILLDFGSSTSFISDSTAAQLTGVSAKQSPCQVRIAGGGTLSSSVTLLAVRWSIGQFSFTSDLRVLPLSAFDMIIGMDWLEFFSPMQVDWKHKRLAIPYAGSTVVMQGDSWILLTSCYCRSAL
jgi:predicted aspartyl protease